MDVAEQQYLGIVLPGSLDEGEISPFRHIGGRGQLLVDPRKHAVGDRLVTGRDRDENIAAAFRGDQAVDTVGIRHGDLLSVRHDDAFEADALGGHLAVDCRPRRQLFLLNHPLEIDVDTCRDDKLGPADASGDTSALYGHVVVAAGDIISENEGKTVVGDGGDGATERLRSVEYDLVAHNRAMAADKTKLQICPEGRLDDLRENDPGDVERFVPGVLLLFAGDAKRKRRQKGDCTHAAGNCRRTHSALYG